MSHVDTITKAQALEDDKINNYGRHLVTPTVPILADIDESGHFPALLPKSLLPLSSTCHMYSFLFPFSFQIWKILKGCENHNIKF